MIAPLPSSLPAVNPPFVTCLARNEMNGNLYCGAMDGSIRFLSNSKDSSGLAVVQPVISCHAAGISDVGEKPEGNVASIVPQAESTFAVEFCE